MSSPFDPLPPNKAVPEHCRTAELFRKLYTTDISSLFAADQTPANYYEKFNQIVPIDRCFCYFQELGIEIVKKNISSGSHGTITLVEYKDHKYVVKVSKISSIRNELNYKHHTQGDLTFIGLHTFSLDTLSSYIINDLFHTKTKIASTAHQYGSSICPTNGVQFLEYSNGGDLRNFVTNPLHRTMLEKHGYVQIIANKPFVRRELLQGILLQILTTLQFAKTKLNLLHNDLKIDNVFISYILDETTGKLRFQTKLADFGKTSVKLGKIVLHFHKQDPAELSKYQTYFDPSATYQIPSNFTLTHNSKMSIYYSSFDIYTLFMSLLLEETYFNTFFYQFDEKSVFFKCWQILFPSSETANKLARRLIISQQNFTRTKMRAAIKQLHNTTLHNDILPKLLQVLKN